MVNDTKVNLLWSHWEKSWLLRTGFVANTQMWSGLFVREYVAELSRPWLYKDG